jgi:hypothetical protein
MRYYIENAVVNTRPDDADQEIYDEFPRNFMISCIVLIVAGGLISFSTHGMAHLLYDWYNVSTKKDRGFMHVRFITLFSFLLFTLFVNFCTATETTESMGFFFLWILLSIVALNCNQAFTRYYLPKGLAEFVRNNRELFRMMQWSTLFYLGMFSFFVVTEVYRKNVYILSSFYAVHVVMTLWLTHSW